MKEYLDLISERLSFMWYLTRHLRDGTFRYRSRDVQQTILATKQYVRATLAPSLGLDRSSPITIELPVKGLTNLLWLVRLADKRCMVYSYLVHQWPRMEQQITALRLLNDNGVRAPRMLHSFADASKFGVYFVATEYVDGISRAGKNQRLSVEEVECVAQQLARLHSVRNSGWGRLCLPRNSDYFARQKRLVSRYLSVARKHRMLTSDQQKRMRSWFYNWRSSFAAVTRFSLIHGDLHPNNILFEPGGGCCLLDTDRVAWNLGMWDVELVHERICRGDTQLIQVFDARYLSLLESSDRELHQRLTPFFAALLRLRLCVRDLGDTDENASMVQAWQELQKLTGLV
ncbi:MAG: phosphotransferase [Candidatus Sumerlaeaceae bacterium]